MLGKIYKIVNSENSKVYIGSTQNELKQRFGEHLSAAKCSPGGIILYKEMNSLGSDKFRIELLSEVSVQNRAELAQIECFYQRLLSPSLNMLLAKKDPLYQKKYDDRHRAQIKKRKEQEIRCPCGKSFQIYRKNKHLLSNFHQNRLTRMAGLIIGA